MKYVLTTLGSSGIVAGLFAWLTSRRTTAAAARATDATASKTRAETVKELADIETSRTAGFTAITAALRTEIDVLADRDRRRTEQTAALLTRVDETEQKLEDAGHRINKLSATIRRQTRRITSLETAIVENGGIIPDDE